MTIAQLHQVFLSTEGLSIDTRTLQPGNLFFALSGENFNGNQYASEALEKGAAYVVIDDIKYYDKEVKQIILVEDALKTLQDLANYHRIFLGLPIIALTGSNGKTTTKNLIQRVLSQQFNVQATKGNLNNHIGVPLTLLSMTEDHDLGLVEMGANHPTEIDFLCQIAEPNYGYITNFGKAHLEGFGSLEGVVNSKAELYRYLAVKRGCVFVYKEDTKQLELTEGQDRIVFESTKDATGDFQLLSAQPMLQIRYKSNIITTNLVGAYNFVNCIAALCIGSYFGVPEDLAIGAITSYTPDNNRSQLVNTERNLLLLDAYNANPTSVRAAIDSFIAEESQATKVLILGDMFELGAYAAQEHQAIVDLLSEYKTVKAYLVGENFYNTNLVAGHLSVYKTRDALAKALQTDNLNAAYILLKGSRGMALEKLVECL